MKAVRLHFETLVRKRRGEVDGKTGPSGDPSVPPAALGEVGKDANGNPLGVPEDDGSYDRLLGWLLVLVLLSAIVITSMNSWSSFGSLSPAIPVINGFGTNLSS